MYTLSPQARCPIDLTLIVRIAFENKPSQYLGHQTLCAKRTIFVKGWILSINIASIINKTLGHCFSFFYTEFSYLQDEGNNDPVRYIIIVPP